MMIATLVMCLLDFSKVFEVTCDTFGIGKQSVELREPSSSLFL